MDNTEWHALLADAENRVDLGIPATDPRVVIQTGHALLRVVETQLDPDARAGAYDRVLAYLALAATRDGAADYGPQFDFLIAQVMGLQGVAVREAKPQVALELFRQVIDHGRSAHEPNLRRTSATAAYFAGHLASDLGDYAGALADYRNTCALTRDVADDLAYSRKLFTAASLNMGYIELEQRGNAERALEIFTEVLDSYRGYARDTAILGLYPEATAISAHSATVVDAPLDEDTGEPIPVEHPAFSHAFTVRLPAVEAMLETSESNRRLAAARLQAPSPEAAARSPLTPELRDELRSKLSSAERALDTQRPHAALSLIESVLPYEAVEPGDEALLAEGYSLAHASLRAAEEHERSLEAARALIDRFGPGTEQKAVARAVFRMALTLDQLNRPGDELRAYRALVARWSASQDAEVRFWVARAQHYSGLTVKRSGDYPVALNYFERAVEYIGIPSTRDLELVVAEVLRDIAATYRELEQIELELDAVERLRAVCGASAVPWVQEIVTVESERHGLDSVAMTGPIIVRPLVEHIEDGIVLGPDGVLAGGTTTEGKHAGPRRSGAEEGSTADGGPGATVGSRPVGTRRSGRRAAQQVETFVSPDSPTAIAERQGDATGLALDAQTGERTDSEMSAAPFTGHSGHTEHTGHTGHTGHTEDANLKATPTPSESSADDATQPPAPRKRPWWKIW